VADDDRRRCFAQRRAGKKLPAGWTQAQRLEQSALATSPVWSAAWPPTVSVAGTLSTAQVDENTSVAAANDW
jgi:hypothetical protein